MWDDWKNSSGHERIILSIAMALLVVVGTVVTGFFTAVFLLSLFF